PDGSNSPFEVSSNILLNDLCHTVAEKLECFPVHILLQYQLDSDKAKAGVTSINTGEELDIFKKRMGELILPQCLTNGKLSTQPWKSDHWKCGMHSKGPESPQYCYSPSGSSTHPHDPTLTSSPSTSSSPPLPPTDIILWFSSLDLNEQQNADGVTFAPFGHMLVKKGFVCISQLTPTFVKLQDLQVWLGIEVGTAILIMQYAEEDWNAVRSGACA
ncbi:hypothetical protein M404DRAFT_930370, partial [Pisolithus tinctorius Marx 270]